MRTRFDRQLEQLNVELIRMGALCEEAISIVAKSLMEDDLTYLPHAIELDNQIDEMEREIESLCLKLLLQQQPVASDLRVVSSALKMISDMERIGDQARDIAEILPEMVQYRFESRLHIGDMARASIKMVTDSIDSFVRKDIDAAKRVVEEDDVVDSLFTRVRGELIAAIAADPSQGEGFLDMLMIAKYFERIGDHATNIAEWVCFSITGEHI
ncbi:MAG: phosphate signaling complex protein PhoU [Clostridiales bacterium]|nr:phosphate signaling complex protein PhoU [Clostridiales bacterium]